MNEVIGDLEAAFAVLDRYRSLEGLIRGFDEIHGVAANPLTSYRRVLVLHLLGDLSGEQEALAFAEREYTRNPTGEVAEVFWRFVERLREV